MKVLVYKFASVHTAAHVIATLTNHFILPLMAVLASPCMPIASNRFFLPQGLFTRVTACHISVFYYVGWAYLMMRRYTDAIKTFSNILFYIGRTKQYHTRSYQYDQILKKNEQMYALLALAVSISPQQQARRSGAENEADFACRGMSHQARAVL